MMEIGRKNKDLIFEEVAVSGVLYITVDNDFVCAQKFSEHVKIQIIFDDNNSNNVKDQKPCEDEQSDVLQSAKDQGIVESDGDLSVEGGSCLENFSQTKLLDDITKSVETTKSSSVSLRRDSKSEIQRTIKSKKYNPSSSSRSNSINNAITSRRKSRKDSNPIKRSHLYGHQKTSLLDCNEIKDNSQKIMRMKGKETKRYFRKLECEKDVYCSYCGQSFKSQQKFFNHRKTERQNHSCDKCQKKFRFKAHLMVHMHKHKDQNIEPGVSSQSKVSISCYGSVKQSYRNRMKCDICGISLSSLNILKTHTMIHTGEFNYKCCVCGQCINSHSLYTKHLASHSKDRLVQCKICNMKFANRSELSKHKFATHKHKCTLCGQMFANRTARYFHYKTFHQNDILKCPECGKLYCNKKELDSHLRYHRNRNKTQCNICGIFVLRLKAHMLSHTSRLEDLEFVCDKCPKQFKRKAALQRHLRIHAEGKLYSCTECSKEFANCGGLRRHMITHMSEKPYVCEICGKSCSQFGNLKIHMRTHNKESHVLHCPHCERNFNHKNALQEHLNAVHILELEGNIFKRTEPHFQSNHLYPIYDVTLS